jgi:hypothetical protein
MLNHPWPESLFELNEIADVLKMKEDSQKKMAASMGRDYNEL